MGMKLDTFMSHIRSQSFLGRAFILNLNYIQLILGLEQPILMSKQAIPYLDMNWILHIREFLTNINAQLQIANLLQIKKQRTDNQNIMETF
jgi:hypothetical protein